MDKKLDSLLTFVYFIGATNSYDGGSVFETYPKYDGKFEINPIIMKAITNQVSGIKLSEQRPFHESIRGVIHMPDTRHFQSANEYHFVLLHEFGHAISNTNDSLQFSMAHAEYWRKHGEAGDTDKLLDTFIDRGGTKVAFKSLSPKAQNLLVTYMKEELQVDLVAAALLPHTGYKETDLIRNDIKRSAGLAHLISSFVGKDFSNEIHNTSSIYARDTEQLFNSIKSEIQKAEKELGMSAKDFVTKEISKNKDREK